MVCVEVRNSTSISPDPSAVKRVDDDSGMKRTFDASLKIAAARPRHMSTSKPCQTPRLSGEAKPATPVWMPQFRLPRARTASSVGLGMVFCADALPATVAHSAQRRPQGPDFSMMFSPSVA